NVLQDFYSQAAKLNLNITKLYKYCQFSGYTMRSPGNFPSNAPAHRPSLPKELSATLSDPFSCTANDSKSLQNLPDSSPIFPYNPPIRTRKTPNIAHSKISHRQKRHPNNSGAKNP